MKKLPLQITGRDLELLTLLEVLPLTSEQLLKASRSFQQPFGQLRLVQRRLQRLSQAGYIIGRPFAFATSGRSPKYYQLTRDGFRLLYGPRFSLPKRRQFEPIGDSRHRHSWYLAEFMTHLLATAAERKIPVRQIARENSVRIESGTTVLYPDCAFQLLPDDGRPLNYVVELDNGTERVRSLKDVESIERKIRGYQAHQAAYEAFDHRRYVVLFVTTRSDDRLKHILQTADGLMSNRDRRLFLGCRLTGFLDAADPLTGRVFLDHRLQPRELIPPGATHQLPAAMAPASALC